MDPHPVTDNKRISIQVSLSGYSFKVETSTGERLSSSPGWLGPGEVFTTPELQRRYDEVDISLMTPKFTLVPSAFLTPGEEREALASVVDLAPSDEVKVTGVPRLGASLVYSLSIGETLSRMIAQSLPTPDGRPARILPEIWYLLRDLEKVPDYNKIIASLADGQLYLTIAQGNALQLANVFRAPDFTTAEYFIFLAIKQLQINPELSTIHFRTPLDPAEEMSLYRYFKSVNTL